MATSATLYLCQYISPKNQCLFTLNLVSSQRHHSDTFKKHLSYNWCGEKDGVTGTHAELCVPVLCVHLTERCDKFRAESLMAREKVNLPVQVWISETDSEEVKMIALQRYNCKHASPILQTASTSACLHSHTHRTSHKSWYIQLHVK